MSFDRERLPDTASYFESLGLILKGSRSAKWKTTRCDFHGGSDSMRVNVASGAWVCMSCDAKGGDVLAYEMQSTNRQFEPSARALGAWVDDGKASAKVLKSTPLSPRLALSVLGFEATLIAVASGNIAHGVALTDRDRARLLKAANRINRLVEVYA